MTREDIFEELKLIPEAKLTEIYDFIHYYRLGLKSEMSGNPTLELAGAWSDMSEEEFQDFLEETETRRREGFLGRRHHEADLA